jgi:hypothetical protein
VVGQFARVNTTALVCTSQTLRISADVAVGGAVVVQALGSSLDGNSIITIVGNPITRTTTTDRAIAWMDGSQQLPTYWVGQTIKVVLTFQSATVYAITFGE